MRDLLFFICSALLGAIPVWLVMRLRSFRLDDEIRLLENALNTKDNRIANLESDISIMKKSIEHMAKLSDTTPPDCVKGVWCTGCQYVKTYHASMGWRDGTEIFYYCGKAESCKNFAQNPQYLD